MYEKKQKKKTDSPPEDVGYPTRRAPETETMDVSSPKKDKSSNPARR